MVSFSIRKSNPGRYTVSIGDLTGSFMVKEAEVIEPEEPEPPPASAVFNIGSLVISPTEINIGQNVTIGALVTNTGELSGNYTVTLRIDNTVVTTKEVTLAVGASQLVNFTTTADTAGILSVDVNGLTETFTVTQAEEVVPPAVPEAINWWIVGSIIAGLVVVTTAAVIWLVLIPRRA
jgi:hypothetical protein